MGDNSQTAWTNATWNFLLGCQMVSPGCSNCYAMQTVHRLSHNPNPKIAAANEGLTRISAGRAVWTGQHRVIPERMDIPRKWSRPRLIFVNSLSDVGLLDARGPECAAFLQTMHDTPRHTYQVLSKRPGFLEDIIATAHERHGTMPHVWWGVTVEHQEMANGRLNILMDAPRGVHNGEPAVRWVSVEPMLGPVDLKPWLDAPPMKRLSWVVIGGESGGTARAFDLKWAADLIAQCKQFGVPVFMKQLGARIIGRAMERIDQAAFKSFDAFPEDLQVREWPKLHNPSIRPEFT